MLLDHRTFIVIEAGEIIAGGPPTTPPPFNPQAA